LAVQAIKIQALKLSKVYTVRLLLRKPFFDINSFYLSALCLLQQFAWIVCLYTKKLKEKDHLSKTLKQLKKRLKKLSPVVLRTVRGARKGIYTTVKICKKTVKNEMDEPVFMAWFFIIRLIASLTLKAGKNMIRKGRCPKLSFVWKHFKRAAGFFTLYPLALLLLVQVI
jgi:hypothetical protein